MTVIDDHIIGEKKGRRKNRSVLWFARCRRKRLCKYRGSTFRVKCDSHRGFFPPREPLLFLEERVPECDRGECQFRVNAVSAGKKCNLTGGNTGSRVAVKNIYWRETVLENRGGSLVSIVSVGEHVYRM